MKFVGIILLTLILSSCGALKLATGLLGGTNSDKSIAKGAQVRLGGTHTDSKTVSLGASIKSTNNQGTQSARDSVKGNVNNSYLRPWWEPLMFGIMALIALVIIIVSGAKGIKFLIKQTKYISKN